MYAIDERIGTPIKSYLTIVGLDAVIDLISEMLDSELLLLFFYCCLLY